MPGMRLAASGTDAHKIIARAPDLECALSARERFAYPLHVHAVPEVLCVVEGSSWLEGGTGATRLHAGDLVLLWSDEPHGGRALDPFGARFFALQASVGRFASEGVRFPPVLPGPLPSRVLRRAFDVHELERLGRAADGRALFEIAARVFAMLARAPRAVTRDSRAAWTRRLPEMLAALPDDELSSGRCAAELGLNPRHFATSFKSVYGVSPRELVVARRVERARRELMTGASLVDVADACGFADQAHLTRSFRRVYGLPPLAFRKRNSVVPPA